MGGSSQLANYTNSIQLQHSSIMKSLILLVLLVAAASAQYYSRFYNRGLYNSYYPRLAYRSGYPSYPSYSRSFYHRLHKRSAEAEPEAEPEAEAEAEADPGTTLVYNTNPYYTAPYPYIPAVKTVAAVKPYHHGGPHLTYGYNGYNAYNGFYHPYATYPAYSPFYHPLVVKPVESNKADAAVTSDDEGVEITRSKREADAEPEAEADPATVVTYAHHRPTYYSHGVYPHVAAKTITYSHTPAYTPAHTSYFNYARRYPAYTYYG